MVPLNLRVDPALTARPTLNVLIPGLAMRSMSGGPNTLFNLTYRMASCGVPVRYISTDIPMDGDPAPLRRHFASLTGLSPDCPNVELACGFDRSTSLPIGAHDVFFASAWWNVQMIKAALPLTKPKRFLYIVQDFEPGLYAWSSEHALALETYALDFYGIVCSELLAQYLQENRIGRFGDRNFGDRCTVFEPAIDRTKFYPEDRPQSSKRRLLFYARPASARRNLFELGLYALNAAVAAGIFPRGQWEFRFIGEQIPPIELPDGTSIMSAPWADYDGYACMLRESDVLLSLMLSPHTSYPPIEMAACGGIAVTNTYANKTQRALMRFSPNIIGVPAAPDSLVDGLREAVRRTELGGQDRSGVRVPASWHAAFHETVPWAVAKFWECLANADIGIASVA